jgi:nicotinamidase/pyrazinamidase
MLGRRLSALEIGVAARWPRSPFWVRTAAAGTRPPGDPADEPVRYAPGVQRYGPGTALIVVDVQNDFADPAGGLSVVGGDAIVPIVDREIARAVGDGALVVATQDWHPPTTPHFAKDGGIWPVHCVAGTWGAELHPALAVPEDAPRVRKGANGEDGYSGFTMRDPISGKTIATELEALLRAVDIERVVVAGLATDYCVKATALDAVRLGFETHVLTDAIAAVDLEPGDGERALEEMRAAGVGLWHAASGGL